MTSHDKHWFFDSKCFKSCGDLLSILIYLIVYQPHKPKTQVRVESCRLQTADRLIRYITLMSIIAWRIFWITLIGRSHPDSLCTLLLAENEWKILHLKIYPQKPLPIEVPTVREVVRWIAQLGGFLGRKRDGEPGPIALWRGWMRFCDLTEGWNLAMGSVSCG